VATTRVRRTASVRLGILAALLLLAGALPWATAGPLPTRLIAAPLLLAGVLMAIATVGLRRTPVTRRNTAGTPPAACGACSCGGQTESGCAENLGLSRP
jgi:hypothetical protein